MNEELSIGQVARRANIGVETVRFYEREGLIGRPSRRASGYRQYEPAVVTRLRFIRRAKELGFTLREIKELLELRLDPTSTCADVKGRAQAKIEDIDSKLASLRRVRKALSRLLEACDGRKGTAECPILDALEEENES